MPAIPNTVTTAEVNASLDQEMVNNFKQDYDRLAEVLGIFAPEVMTAGVALNQIKVDGALNDAAADGTSSGTAYVEGEEVALSKYTATKVPVGVIKARPYRKLTTADAIMRSGYDVAVLRTDQKLLSQLRGAVLTEFFTDLNAGTGAATGTNLQTAIANTDAVLGDALEANGDTDTGGVVHFVNRLDAAEYLGTQTVTVQTAFGLTYLESFLGTQRVFLTSKVAHGTVVATPIENVHIYGVDFASLAQGGLAYEQDGNGLIGVAHEAAYDRVSAETNVLCGMRVFPEVTDYIVKGSFAKPAPGEKAVVGAAVVGKDKASK